MEGYQLIFKMVEKAFVDRKTKATVFISGNTYEIDFESKRQYQPNRGTRRRKVTRGSRAELGDRFLGIAGVPKPDPVIDLTNSD
ncbi:Oidioi.mRNA.OKI2018_I69.chr2.g5924.t1.cds [Oikopleura dioica]|uniref:Oidioi.mRNA.OKI2018_I69.chr2.g5924.t1.cds n=1 Tax=Oikopleura dioica TaxID=34765 RepID=A0ABN7T5D5_OIKDI|nr:Oidioi.mRNA.OKI2018_I69.chr2.g5924.t1.cds [Oikopleura dioica]